MEIILIFIILIFLFSVIIHEVSHGLMADYLGDPTAKLAGRLTLNPISHLDPIGSIVLPLFCILFANLTGGGFIFGWAKPVPVNPYNFRDQKYGEAKVALAGPAANLAIAIVFGLCLRFLPLVATFSGLYLMFAYIVYINILLAVFNLIPVPPLDGSHILFTFLPIKANNVKVFLNQFGFVILLVILMSFFQWISLAINWIFTLIVGHPFF